MAAKDWALQKEAVNGSKKKPQVNPNDPKAARKQRMMAMLEKKGGK